MDVGSTLQSQVSGLLSRVWERLKQLEYQNDLVLLAINPFFIPKKLLRDALKQEAVQCHGDLIVDAGCGWQPYRPYFSHIKHYMGLDLSLLRRPDIAAAVDCLPLKAESADIVLCTEVIEHTQEPKKVCRELARVLRKGGSLLVSAPMSWNLHYKPYDYYRFTCYGLTYILEESGFEVVKTIRIGGVVSLIGARLTDIIQRKVQRLPLVRRTKGSNVIAVLSVCMINVIFYALGRLLDKIDETDAIGWLVVARKRGDPTRQPSARE